MFEVVKNTELGTVWLPVAPSVTLTVGQLVYRAASDPVNLTYFPAASGGGTAKPVGVVVATNLRKPLYSSTYSADYITGVASRADQLALEKQGAQGSMFGVGDPAPLVQVKLIGPQTEIKGTLSAAPTPFQPSAVGTNGDTLTRSGLTLTDYFTTVYCRSGANQGIYRQMSTYDASDVLTFPLYWPYTTTTSDYFVAVNTTIGNTRINVDTDGRNLNVASSVASNYYSVVVEEINLEEAGKEYIIFRFV